MGSDISYSPNEPEEFKNIKISDPYSILNISSNASHLECKSAYMKLATNPDRITRTKACLAYDIICNKNKYIKNDNTYEPKIKDCFYYTIIGDLNSLKYYIEFNKALLNKKDELNRSLLYLAARNGYYNLTEYLLNKGINVNEVQNDGSTALHGAAYYGQQLIIQLLIDHGIDTSIKNRFGNTAAEEAKTTFIKDLINNSNQDRIIIFFHELYSKGLISNIIPIKKQDKIICYKLMISKSKLPYNLMNIYKDWIPVWHGTKFRFLEPIVKNGLKPSGSKLKDGTTINPLPGHIEINQTVAGIKCWAKAIFVSPSLFYASDVVYAERIMSNNQTWAVLVEGRLKPGTFSKHNSTVLNYNNIPGEPSQVEYRVEQKSDDDLIYRIASEQNIVVTSISFVLIHFLDNISNYCEGNIVINSQNEKMLLEY